MDGIEISRKFDLNSKLTIMRNPDGSTYMIQPKTVCILSNGSAFMSTHEEGYLNNCYISADITYNATIINHKSSTTKLDAMIEAYGQTICVTFDSRKST